MTGCSSGSPGEREKYPVELQKKALEEDCRSEARERAKMGKEDSTSREAHGVGDNS